MAKNYGEKIDRSMENSAHTKLLRMCGQDKRVLDVGCLGGHLARALVEQNCVVSGVEIDPEAAARASEVCDRVVVGDLDLLNMTLEFAGEQFDVIVFGDVVEHLKSPQKVLNEARMLLAPGGFIGISVPNIAHISIRLMLLKGEFNYQDIGILDDTHLRFFTRKSLCDLLESCGYIVDSLEWTELPILEEELREALDDLGLNDVGALIEKFASPEAVAFQYIAKAVPATEEAQVQLLAGEKINAERRVAQLEHEAAVQRQVAKDTGELAAAYNTLEQEIVRRGEYCQTLEQEVARRDNYMQTLEHTAQEHASELAAARTRVFELETELTACQEQASQLREELAMRLTARLRRRVADRRRES